MLSSSDLERLIAVKRHEIEKEKMLLGLASPHRNPKNDEDKENSPHNGQEVFTSVKQSPSKPQHIRQTCEPGQHDTNQHLHKPEVPVPADLERYIRRYIGLPVMLKTGEYSPNHPLLRGNRETQGGDVFVGLGDYEEKKKSLRRLRQQEYREYLDQQAKKKREEKEKAERELCLAEERERERERERKREEGQGERVERRGRGGGTADAGIQCGHRDVTPLSVAVQTDDADFEHSPQSSPKLTQAERELSPRTVGETLKAKEDERPIRPARWRRDSDHNQDAEIRRRSYGEFDDGDKFVVQKSNRDKLLSDLKHTYMMPAIFDDDAIHLRNVKTKQEAASRSQSYQRELRCQIEEQQRIREERKTREKMLERAEMRRLEEQLRTLGSATDAEMNKHDSLTHDIRKNTEEYEKKKSYIQQQIDSENFNLHRSRNMKPRPTFTSKSDTAQNTIPSKLPFYYRAAIESTNDICTNSVTRMPFSTNIPETSIFSPNYDVDSYLRKNLNPNKEILRSNRTDKSIYSPGSKTNVCYANEYVSDNLVLNETNNRFSQSSGAEKRYSLAPDYGNEEFTRKRNFDFDKFGSEVNLAETKVGKYEPEPPFSKKTNETLDTLPIPVLRHSPRMRLDLVNNVNDGANCETSDAMRLVEDKWKVPAVQKNILKSLPGSEGKNVSILTQLGSIRRQLQMEQLKLDRMLGKDGAG